MSGGTSTTAVRALAAGKRYATDGPAALGAVDLAVAPGRFVSVMGPSGSGKSTLLHLLGGLDRPTSGDVEVGGRSLGALDDRALTELRRRSIGFVFQSFNLVPVLSAADNIALPAVIAGEKGDVKQRVAAALASVGLEAQADRVPAQLSGGQQQRVAVARALFMQPALVLADEPTGNLDSASGADVLGLLRRAVDEQGTTLVMVTHDPRAAATGDEVVLLRDGGIVGHLVLPDAHPEVRTELVLRFFADPTATAPQAAPPRPAAATPAPRRTPRRAAGR